MTARGQFISEEILRQLYLDERLTDTQIAKEYGATQTTISRLRQKYGIQTILKSDRLNLPLLLSSRLQSILVGSMLGDGRLYSTGEDTASFCEFHSIQQKRYLEWKVKEFEPFSVQKLTPHNKGKHKGFQFRTHAARVFKPYWKLFYPEGFGNKTVKLLDPKVVDALALAVWYLDDGSKNDSYVRFAIGPDLGSQKVQIHILSIFGFDGRIYGEGGESTVRIAGGRDAITKFVDLIAPHVPSCMSYKLELKSRKRGPSARNILTKDAIKPFVERGIPADRIAKILGVPRSNLRRALDKYGFERNKAGRPPKRTILSIEEVDSLIAEQVITEEDDDIYEQASNIVNILLQVEFPVTIWDHASLLLEANQLRKAPTYLDVDGLFKKVSQAGYSICNQCFPYRFDARYYRGTSVRQAWANPELLRQAIYFQWGRGHGLSVKRIFRAIQAISHAPTNFRPSLAKAIVDHFCPENGVVLDPCAGYGGRASGTLASGRRYIGIEPHPKAPEAFKQLSSFFDSNSLTLINEAFEDVSLNATTQVDLVFTSPPYYCVERYSDDVKQSWVRYLTWTAWVENFLHPLVNKSKSYLKPGGIFCVNTKNIKMQNIVYPIADELTVFAKESDFIHISTLALPIGSIGQEARTEPLLVFQKRT